MGNEKVKPIKDDGLFEFVKPNGTVVRVNQHSAEYAASLGWLPRADYEKLLAEQAKAEADAKKKKAEK